MNAKPWLERVPADPANSGSSVDGTVWALRSDIAQKQRRTELRNWLAQHAEIITALGK